MSGSPVVSLEALERQLASTFAGRSADEVLKELDRPEVVQAVLQKSLLEKLSLSSSTVELLPLLCHRDALEALLCSGGCRNWNRATEFLTQMLTDPACERDGLWLRLCVASALYVGEGQSDSDYTEEPVDIVVRCHHFHELAQGGRLFPEFKSLRTWHLRYVLGCWHSDQDLEWARQHVSSEYCKPDKIGSTVKLVKYIDRNERGVSVQQGLRFYDDQKATLARIHQYGGVCGAVSKFAASCCNAFGVPAIPVGQPGHCAMIWRGPGGEWKLENDGGGWNKSNVHDKIQRTWLQELGEDLSRKAGFVFPAMEACQGAGKSYLQSELLRLVAPLCLGQEAKEDPRFDMALELLALSVTLCPHNLPAWNELLQCYFGCSTAARQAWLDAKVAQAGEVVAARCRSTGQWMNVGLFRPVKATSAHEKAKNVVDGTSSEWFTKSDEEPQRLEIDLERPCSIQKVRIQWWGDYGGKSGLQLFSCLEQGGPFTQRSSRAPSKTELNGWSELAGWAEPTRIVLLEFRKPSKDCFGLGMFYGIRQVELLGQPLPDFGEASQDEQSQLCYLSEAILGGPGFSNQQTLNFMLCLVKKGSPQGGVPSDPQREESPHRGKEDCLDQCAIL